MLYKMRDEFFCRNCNGNTFKPDDRAPVLYAICDECGAVYNMILRIRVA